MDLQLLRDGHVVVLHDDSLWRTAAVSWISSVFQGDLNHLLRRPVGELELAEVRAVRVGDSSHSEPIPLFSDALHELCTEHQGGALGRAHLTTACGGGGESSKHPLQCFAEIKADGYSSSASFDPRLTSASAAAVAEAAIPPAQLTWISFSLGALVDMKRRLPEHPALLVAYVQTPAQAASVARLAVQSGLDGIDLNADPSVVTAELVEWLHARGKRIAVWVWKAPGSNDVESVWEHMERCGVDFFTSNLPPALHEWRARGARSAAADGVSKEPAARLEALQAGAGEKR